MARILIVEDDAALARGIVALLKDGGYAVDHVARGAEALQLEEQEPYRAIILDIGLPDLSGFEVLQRLRQRGAHTPVLILTARDALADRVKGLDLGGDDYLLKPFEPAELEARVRALVRRGEGNPSPTITIGALVWDRASGVVTVGGAVLELRRGEGNPSPTITIGALVWDRASGVVTVGGAVLELRRRELAVLQTLLTSAGKLVLKERLAAEVFDFDEPVGPNALEVYVGRVRRKLMPNGPTIRTVRGLGYMLEPS